MFLALIELVQFINKASLFLFAHKTPLSFRTVNSRLVSKSSQAIANCQTFRQKSIKFLSPVTNMNNQVIIVDDHPVVRMTVRILLEGEGYKVVGETENGADAIELIREFQPGTVVLDIGLPKVDGLTVISRLAALHLQIKIIVLTAQISNHIAIRCMEAGAHGFVSKQEDLCELVSAIRAVGSGQNYFPEKAFCLTRREAGTDHEDERLRTLSVRELGVLQYLTQGLSNKQIAERMLLSGKTISTYKTRILTKLNANTVLDLYDLAKRNGLTEP